MPVIDAHVHLYPPEINGHPAGWAAQAGEGAWGAMSVRTRRGGRPVQAFPTAAELLRMMDFAGVERSVLLGWYWQTAAACELQNRFFARLIREHPDRLSAFAAFQPRAGLIWIETELTRIRDEGFAGIGELCPPAQGYAMDGPELRAVVQGAAGFCLNFHVTDPAGRPYPGRVETPLVGFVELARRHPETRFILAHWGGLLPLTLNHAVPENVFYDTAASPLLYDAGVWQRFLAEGRGDQVLFGSDYPLELFPLAPGHGVAPLLAEARASGLPASTLEAVLSGNARRVILRPPAT